MWLLRAVSQPIQSQLPSTDCTRPFESLTKTPRGKWRKSSTLERKDEWPDDPESRLGIVCQFDGAFGDRRQELVFIGRKLDEAKARAALDACLLTDAEMAGGPEAWAALADPLPEWPTPQQAMAAQQASGGEA